MLFLLLTSHLPLTGVARDGLELVILLHLPLRRTVIGLGHLA